MEKNLNLKVSVRLNQRCREVVDQVSFNHLILFCGKQQSQHRKFQVDKIYSPTDSNEKLFQHILRIPSNLMLEGFSSVVFCLGSPGSGKTYSLAGKTYQNQQKQIEPGIMIYMMRRLFSKFKHEVSLYSTYSFWCRFLFVQKGKVRDLEGQISEYQWQNNQNTKVLIKNYSHFQQLIAQVYSNNNSKCHTIIQLILQKQTPNQQSTTSSVTFVQFGSFFYNCSYREAQKFSMENDIEATFLTIKNLQRAKQQGLYHMFDSSLLTRVLRKTLLKACSFQFLGILDQESQNNLKTLNFLDIIMHKKKNYVYSKNAKQQIKREQIFLKGLYQKHRRVLNLLSRCIGMQLGYLDKQKKRNFDGPVLNTFYKTCEKIKYANLKKVQNEKKLQQIKKQIDIEKAELLAIDAQYEEKFRKLQNQRLQILTQKQQLVNQYQSTVNPSIKFSHTDNSLYYKLDELESSSYKKFNLQEEQRMVASNHPMETERQSKNEGKSFKLVYSTHQISNRKNAPIQSQKSIVRNRINDRYERNQLSQINQLGCRRLKQIKTEIGKIFEILISQNLEIQKLEKQIPLHHQDILNKLKNRNNQINFNVAQAQNCYLNLPESKNNAYQYKGMVQNLKIHSKVQKDLANSNANSTGAISLKSLRSDKQFKA